MVVPTVCIARFDRVVEADERVVDEGCRVRDAVQVQRESGRRGVEGEIDLVGEDGHGLARLQPAGIRDRERDAVSREAAEVVPGGRDRERAAGHAGDGSARMNVAFVEEVDVPGIGTGGQRAVFGIGRGPAEGDDVARPEDCAIGRRGGCVTTGRLPALIVIGVESVELTPSETVSRA